MSYTRFCWPDHAGLNTGGAVIYFVSGARRSFIFTDDKGVVVSLSCEDGDLVCMEGNLSASSPCDVGALAIESSDIRGIAAVTFILRFEWSAAHTCPCGTDLTHLKGLPTCVPSFVEYGRIGVDVEAKQSTIVESGLGLFLLRDYPEGGVVTEYDGPLRFHSKVTGKRETSSFLESSHWRSVPGTDFVIVGISETRGLFHGQGGASLANHKRGSEANCKFEIIWTESMLRPRFCEDDGCYHTVPRIVLTLLRPGFKGEELFVDYGDVTANRFLKHTVSLPVSPKRIAPFHEKHFFSNPTDAALGIIGEESMTPLDVVTLSPDAMVVINSAVESAPTVRYIC